MVGSAKRLPCIRLAAFTVDPGTHASGFMQLRVTYYDVVSADGEVVPFESFTLRRSRADSPRA